MINIAHSLSDSVKYYLKKSLHIYPVFAQIKNIIFLPFSMNFTEGIMQMQWQIPSKAHMAMASFFKEHIVDVCSLSKTESKSLED